MAVESKELQTCRPLHNNQSINYFSNKPRKSVEKANQEKDEKKEKEVNDKGRKEEKEKMDRTKKEGSDSDTDSDDSDEMIGEDFL